MPSAPKAPHNGALRQQAAYLRASTLGQDPENQRAAIERAAAARGQTVELWFQEIRSGDIHDRPQLDSLRNLARRGEVSHVWLFALDRLTRCGARDMLNLVTEFRRHGVTLLSVTEPVDFDGPMAEVIVAMLGVQAKMELERIRERTAAAKLKAQKAGKHWGRPQAGKKDQRAQLRQLLEEGLTLRKAAKEAGLSYGTAQRIIAGDRQDGKK